MRHQETSSRFVSLRNSVSAALRGSLVVGALLCANSFAWSSQAARPNPPLPAPEINPALIVGAVVLVVGGLLILTSRKRRSARNSQS